MWSTFLVGLIAGFAATPHCMGMCGGFPLYLAGSPHSRRSLLRQALFIAGKSFTYVFMGALAGSLGTVIFRDTSMAPAAYALRILVGLFTISVGLLMAGVRFPKIRFLERFHGLRALTEGISALRTGQGMSTGLILGLAAGFLPCPLPMGMLALAVGSRSAIHGMALMAGVGLGTAPGLLAVGLFGIGLKRRFADLGMRVAGIVVLAIGLLIVGRATGLLNHSYADSLIPSCCSGESQQSSRSAL